MRRTVVATSLVLVSGFAAARQAVGVETPPAEEAREVITRLITPRPVPPVGAGVTELKFSEIFRLPVGRYGLEPSEKLESLDGRRVRMIGYMVHQEDPAPGRLILVPFPLSTAEDSDGMADDLPPSQVFVHLPDGQQTLTLPFVPQLLAVEGQLSIGPEAEPDGRISNVRLILDPFDPLPAPRTAGRTDPNPATAAPADPIDPTRSDKGVSRDQH